MCVRPVPHREAGCSGFSSSRLSYASDALRALGRRGSSEIKRGGHPEGVKLRWAYRLTGRGLRAGTPSSGVRHRRGCAYPDSFPLLSGWWFSRPQGFGVSSCLRSNLSLVNGVFYFPVFFPAFSSCHVLYPSSFCHSYFFVVFVFVFLFVFLFLA